LVQFCVAASVYSGSGMWPWRRRAREPLLLDAEGGFERTVSTRPPSPESQVGWFGFLAFTWFDGIVSTAYKRDQEESKLEQVDLYQLCDVDLPTRHLDRLEHEWAKELSRPEPSLIAAMSRAFFLEVLQTGWIKLINDAGHFAGPFMLNRILAFVQDGSTHVGVGYMYAAVITISSGLQAFAMAHYFQKGYRTGMRLRASLILMVYQKALRVSPWAGQTPSTASSASPSATPNGDAGAERRRCPFGRRGARAHPAPRAQVGGIGQMTNLISADTDKFTFLMPYFNLLWSAPLQLVICFSMLIAYVQWALLAGLFVMFFFMWTSSIVQKKARSLQAEAMKAKDTRLKLQVELLKIVKIIKLYAWETTIEDRVKELRNKEMALQLKYKLWNMVVFMSFNLSPTIVSLTTFSFYTMVMGKNLDAATAFTALSLFNIITFPLSFLPMMYGFLIQARVSADRIRAFLLAQEVDARPGPPQNPSNAVELVASSLTWPDGSTLLNGVDLKLTPGSLTCIVGKTGSGKSGLLYALLGELSVDPQKGHVGLGGSIGYCAQNAWIRNATVRDNITGGANVNEDRYQEVIHACCLIQDFETLTDGDNTLIGDRGINLSGGQKQRVALARAVYADPDIYILDDVLSALDSHVATHICGQLLRGPLFKGKTVVLVTHSSKAYALADVIVALGGNEVKFKGSYQDFNRSGLVDAVADSPTETRDSSRTQVASGSEPTSPKKSPGEKKSNTTNKPAQEERRQGAVSFAVYKAYMSACGGCLPVGFFFLTVVLGEGSKNLSDVWLTHWSNGGDTASSSLGYAIIALITLCMGLIYVLARVFVGQAASRRLHENCVHALLRAKMSFYDTTPTGQILNRLAEDTNILDYNLPQTLGANCVWVWRSAAIVIVCMIVGWYLVFLLVPMFFIYGRLSRRYLPATRDLRRLDASARSPIFHHFGETMNGITTIRAMRQQTKSFLINVQKMEVQMEAYYLVNTAARWLSLRLQFNGTVLVGSVAALGVGLSAGGHLNPGVVGLAITYAMKLTDTLNQVNRESADRETQMVSVERMHQYSCDVEPEAALEIPDRDPPATWPSRGDLDLHNVTMRYRPELPIVLDNLSVSIKGGQRIGVVGRTGCGKSSLMLTLLRIIEPQAGVVTLDEVDTANIGLHTLRRSAAIIPQDPSILTGSVRFNLDPFNTKEDRVLWQVLEKAQLAKRVESAGGLDSNIEEGGSNYSVGEMQLLCLARALLRRQEQGGLLLLDEATSALDAETDKTIQEAIRSEFNCTTITIAHRIRTLLDYDRVLVLSEGKVVEFGSPKELFHKDGSLFRSLALEDGVSM